MKAPHLLFLTALLALLSAPLAAAEADYLSYAEFIAKVESGSVKAATLDQFSEITGTHEVDGEEREFRSYGDTGSANDILLTRLLKQRNVVVTLQEREERPWYLSGLDWISAAWFLIPFIILILAFKINAKVDRLSS